MPLTNLNEIKERNFRVSPVIYKRFLRAIARAAKKRYGLMPCKKGEAISGETTSYFSKQNAESDFFVKPGNIYAFQSEALKKGHIPVSSEEIDLLQQKVKEVLEKEKYVASIHENERETLRQMNEKFGRLEEDIEKKLEDVIRSQEEQRQKENAIKKEIKRVKTELKKTKISQKKVVSAPELIHPALKKSEAKHEINKHAPKKHENPYARILKNIEDKIALIEAQHKKLLKNKSVDKGQLQRFERIISQYRKRLERLKKKYAQKLK